MSRHLITTPAESGRCPRCGGATLRAISEGLAAIVDPTPIPAELEYQILLTGAWTYTLRPMTGELIHRADWRIRSAMLVGTIHAQHVCVEKPTQMELELDTPRKKTAA